MTTQALYNKWRGQTFADILGQEHITRTLQNQIKAGRIGHAYLFTGLRGTGKTSTARIMAKAVNCVGQTDDPPCNQCPICRAVTEGRALDLIEIDAASNRGIDEIRALRDRVNFAPSESRYKVYVIDEVHMLTNEAFNALLKTLEEPPAHVIFILCTTEPHRLPDTVLSRCQPFDFRRGTLPVLVQNLRHICDEEHIAIAPDALEYIARQAAGSFRDGVSLLDQLAAYDAGEVTLELVQRVLGSPAASLVARLARSLLSGDIASGLYAIDEALNQGAEPRQFLSEILDYLRSLMLVGVGSAERLGYLGSETLAEMRQDVQVDGFSLGRLIRAIKLFNEAGQSLRTATHPRLPLELAFVEAALASDAARTDATSSGEGPSATAPARMVRETPSVAVPPMSSSARLETPVAADDAPVEQGAATMSDRAEAKENLAVESVPASSNASATPSAQNVSAPDASVVTPETGKLSLEWVQGNWELVLIKIKPQSNQVRALLNSAYPMAVDGDKVILACEADFHREKLMEGKRQSLIEQVLSEVIGSPCRVECVVKPLPQDRDTASDRATARRGQNGLFNAPSATRSEPSATPATSPPAAPVSAAPDARTELLNHPAVKKLQRLGGRVSQVIVPDQEEKENQRGQ